MVTILGISCHYHDAAASLIKDGRIIAAVAEERFTRKKHDFGFPENAINFCLKTAGITSNNLDYVVFHEKPFVKFERLMMTILGTYPQSSTVFRESMLSWLKDKLWVKNTIAEKLRLKNTNKILFSDHHLSHAASAFLCSPFNESAIITADAVGEWTTATIGYGKNNKINLLKELRFPHSFGLLYSAITAFLGFEVNEGEYKVMGLAPFGKPKHKDKIYKLINLCEDGSFSLNMKYFIYHRSIDKMFSKKFEQLFGKPCPPEDREKIIPYYADIAASMQEVFEEMLIKTANHAYELTKIKNLCFAGGVALNSKANYRILNETPFEDLFIQPAAGDDGGSLGAALFVYYSLLENSRDPTNSVLKNAYFGQEYTEKEIKDFLDSNKLKYQYFENEGEFLDEVVKHLLNQEVVGWFQGRFEWGPRALGNRSIIADPRNPEMKDVVNNKIKFREPFRPFAPSVLAEKAHDFFELPDVKDFYPIRFMVYVTPVKKNKQNIIPAVTHVDGTGRLQSVFKEDNPRYYSLIEKFEKKTGVPIILNTSFNLKGEPIVNTPQNAYDTFMRSGMDALVLEKFIITKT
ncbi:MAG: carbamoyltransferase [Candidatus Aenigmarchaeota archaeon]|nr:carbamoyltransferase [Candidatus Aenigmarchaeota archaeon]